MVTEQVLVSPCFTPVPHTLVCSEKKKMKGTTCAIRRRRVTAHVKLSAGCQTNIFTEQHSAGPKKVVSFTGC